MYKFNRYLDVFTRYYCQKVESKYIWHIWHTIRYYIGITLFKSLTKSKTLKRVTPFWSGDTMPILEHVSK